MDEQNPSSPGTPPASAQPPVGEAQHRLIMGVLSYLGILVIIPILAAKEDPFVKFHIRQGLVLLIGEVLLWLIVGTLFWRFYMLGQLINLGIVVLVILGIVNVVKGKQEELPLVGSLAAHLPL